MGSDLYMESNNWRPRPTKVTWLNHRTISIEKDAFYHGYQEVYRGPVTEDTEPIFKAFGVTIPPKPKDDLLYDMKHKIRITGDSDQPSEYYDSLMAAVNKALNNLEREIMAEFPELKVEAK